MPPSATPEAADVAGKSWPFLLGLLLLAVGFQIHFSINSAGQYLKFSKAENLEWLMPVFWLGFGVAMMPGSALCKRFGTLHVMVVSAVLGALGAYASAGSLDTLIAAQVVAGGAWGSMLMCGFTAVVVDPPDGEAREEALIMLDDMPEVSARRRMVAPHRPVLSVVELGDQDAGLFEQAQVGGNHVVPSVGAV